MGGVGQRIKELRKASHLTQQELAEGVVTRSYISQIEKGLIQPSYDTLEKLAKKLEVTVEDFFKEPENTALIVAEWKKYIRFAEGQAESGQYDQARRTLDNANLKPSASEELNDHDLGILNWVRGKLAEVELRYDDAIAYYERSIEHFASYMYAKERVRSMDGLAYVKLQLNSNEEAMQILDRAYAILLQNQIGGMIHISVLVNLGVAHAKLHEYHSAIRLLKEALNVNQRMDAHYKAGHICMTLGICHMELRNWEEGIELYHRALTFYGLQGQSLTSDLNRAGAYTNLGELYRKSGRYRESITALQTASQLYEENLHEGEEWFKLVINAKLELSKSFFHSGDLAEVEVLSNQVLNLSHEETQHGMAYLLLGLVAYKKAGYDAALTHFQAAQVRLSGTPHHREVLQHLADTHAKLGNWSQAVELYQHVQQPTREFALA